ncbi:uncharacterized protein TRAVEDRAFT_100835, partial [Trametes versicolor FP-101664 SS1]|uniref:uncharacterized protein n=1 Tax=Trametes versicolor (strain FP-101664) TaxID=717944 RepID=UPI00046234BE
QKPSLDQINHFLKPLVDELLVLWETGVFFSRTANYPSGRLVRCALIPLVCDLPAARQTAGFGAHNAKFFCSMCHQKRSDIDDLDISSWIPRSCEEHREAAQAWKDKATPAQREAAFKDNSTRWSELLNLPYWDPISYTVIDSMHNHYLGLLKHHCRKIWGMNASSEDAEDPDAAGPSPPSEEDLSIGLGHLYSGTNAQLASWSSMMAHIHAELRNTELPSWINPVPRNVGTTSRGKLSADQWHIFCVINLPIILIPKWAPKGGRSVEMLENYMHLVTEVVVGSLLEMSEEAITLYETSALAYLKTTRQLYGISLTPNQHNSLHIPFFLRLFGPLHSIRTFFSERMNYLLQQQNTNLKFG